MATRNPGKVTPKKRRSATGRNPKKRQTGLQVLNEITDELSRLHEEVSALPSGPGKVMLLEQLLGTYDKLIAILKEKVERHQAKTRTGAATPARTRRRR